MCVPFYLANHVQMMSMPSSVAVIVIDEPRSCGHWAMRVLSGNPLSVIFTIPIKKSPLLHNSIAFFTEANHESPHTMRPLPCHGSLKRNVVAVPAPSSHCHRFSFIASFPSLISALIIIPDATSASVFTSHPTPLGFFLFSLLRAYHPEWTPFYTRQTWTHQL